MDKLRRTLGGQEGEGESSPISNESFFPSMSWEMRIKGFLACFILGFILSIIGGIFLAIPSSRGILLFVLFYTIGNIVSLISTMFLMGPFRQLKKMFAKTRIIATLLVFLFMILTILSGVWHKVALAIICCICQFLAFTWYSLSYIPYARKMVKSGFNTCFA
ncbi:unnamed protein product [Sphagnum balticum]